MPRAYQSVSLTVAAGSVCEDRVLVREWPDGILLVVADGAGGTGNGDQAAEHIVQHFRSIELDAEHDFCRELMTLDRELEPIGQSTAVVLQLSESGVIGASVGDSVAWNFCHKVFSDLTAGQKRKPLLGSGEAWPISFRQRPDSGIFLLATDGLANYSTIAGLQKRMDGPPFESLPERLVESVRLPSGALWDDIGIIACRITPPA